MPGWGFLFLIFPVIVGFLLTPTLYCFKRSRFLSVYAFFVPPLVGWASWGALIWVTNIQIEHSVYFDRHPDLAGISFLTALALGALCGAASGTAIGFALSWGWRHAG